MGRSFHTVNAAKYWPHTTRREWDEARRLAGRAVAEALRRGTLVRQRCERCQVRQGRGGRPSIAEAHHDDYSKPLDVMWLCRRHHRERHRELGARIVTPDQFQDIRQRENRRLLLMSESSEPIVRDLTVQVMDAMLRNGVTQMELARRLGTTRQAASQLFNGGIRTMKALVGISGAIGCEVVITIRDKQNGARA